MRVEGIINNSGYIYTSVFVDFVVNLYDCVTSVITPSDLSNFDYYLIKDGEVNISYTEWQESVGFCGPFAYSFSINSTTLFTSFLPNTITINTDST